MRNVLKKCRELAAGSDPAAAESAFRLAVKKLDQAAAKHLIHANAAARTKSRSVAACEEVGYGKVQFVKAAARRRNIVARPQLPF